MGDSYRDLVQRYTAFVENDVSGRDGAALLVEDVIVLLTCLRCISAFPIWR